MKIKTATVTATINADDLINATALAVADFVSAEDSLLNTREILNDRLVAMKKAGIPLAFSTYSAEGRLEKKAVMTCPTRKALKSALQEGGMGVDRSESVVQFLALYYATGIPVASLRKVEDVVSAIGLDRLQKLRAIKPNSKPFKPDETAGVTPTENAGKQAEAAGQIKPISKGRMPKITPIWALWEALQGHEDSRLFNEWVNNGMTGTLQSYVEGAKGDAANKLKLAAALAEVERLKELVQSVGDGKVEAKTKPKAKAKAKATA